MERSLFLLEMQLFIILGKEFDIHLHHSTFYLHRLIDQINNTDIYSKKF